MAPAERFSLEQYIDVAERIFLFTSKYPEGSLQTLSWQVTEVANKTFIIYQAAAYRTPDDRRPGHGTAWEPFPGPTPYTKDSELMNAETAAWGRACVAVGIMANRKIASRQEVQARRGPPASPPLSDRESAIEPDAQENATAPDALASLKDAARGLKWAAIKDCYGVAGLVAPEYLRDAFRDLDDEQALGLRAALQNRKIADVTDVPFLASEVATGRTSMLEDELVAALTTELDGVEETA